MHDESHVNAYKKLKAEMEENLEGIGVYKSGNVYGSKYQIYLLGRSTDGGLVGLTSYSVEI